MAVKDLFSETAADYARFRPTYPPALFAWLADQSPSRLMAVDLGTGSGQAALGLAEHFDRVVGLDASDEQLANARRTRASNTGAPPPRTPACARTAST